MNASTRRTAPWLAPLIAVGVALVLGAILVAIAGVAPGDAAQSFARGIAGSRYQLAEVAVAATPLLWCGLAAAIPFRAGLLSIGAEGQLLGGMIAATALGVLGAPFHSFPVMLLGGAIAGALVAGLAAVLRAKRRVPEVLSTLLLNFVLLQCVALAVQTFLREPGGSLPRSAQLPAAATLAPLVDGTRLHSGFLLALAAALVMQWVLGRTVFGFRLRAAGLAPRAALFAGFPVERDLLRVFLVAGALAGCGGAIEVAGVTQRLYENPSPGFGYMAIAVALLGRNQPLGVAAAAIAFGALDTGCLALARDHGVPRGLAQVIEALAIVVFLVVQARESRGVRGDSGTDAAASELPALPAPGAPASVAKDGAA